MATAITAPPGTGLGTALVAVAGLLSLGWFGRLP